MCPQLVSTGLLKIHKQTPHLRCCFWPSLNPIIRFKSKLFYLIPTLPINEKRGLRIAIALNDEQPTEVVLNYVDGSNAWWNAVMNATLIMKSRIHVSKVDNNSLVIYGTDPGVVIDKITIDLGGLKESYLGPKENV